MRARITYYRTDWCFLLNILFTDCEISVRIKIIPIKTPIVGTVGMSNKMARRCPSIQFNIPKETAIERNDLRFLVKILANDAGITNNPITIIAPTLSKLKTVDILDRPSSR